MIDYLSNNPGTDHRTDPELVREVPHSMNDGSQ